MLRQKHTKTVTNQSNPVANEVSMAGAMSLAAVMMYFSARTFLCTVYKENNVSVACKDKIMIMFVLCEISLTDLSPSGEVCRS